jgi:hypothetical protein
MEAPIYENHILKFTFNSKLVSAQELLVASSRFKASVSSHCLRVPLAIQPSISHIYDSLFHYAISGSFYLARYYALLALHPGQS